MSGETYNALAQYAGMRAALDESIYPQRILKPCKCFASELVFKGDEDIRSVSIIFEHMRKYGVPSKKPRS
jgi:hypothetical protein